MFTTFNDIKTTLPKTPPEKTLYFDTIVSVLWKINLYANAHGIPQQEVARRAGLPDNYFDCLAHGSVVPTLMDICKLFTNLDLELSIKVK